MGRRRLEFGHGKLARGMLVGLCSCVFMGGEYSIKRRLEATLVRDGRGL